MCLLTFMSAGTTASIEDLTTGGINNPDGFGYAIHAGNRIIRKSGLNFDAVLDDFLTARAKHGGPALFHSRITTHGGTSLGNCHPFQVGRDSDTVVAHNGMLPIVSRDGKSDTRIFAESLFPSWGGVRTLDSRRMRRKLSKFADGSKLVFLTADRRTRDDYYIINEEDGHWVDGVWWSNNSYKWARYSYVGGSMYTTGWSRTNDEAIVHKYIDAEDRYIVGDHCRAIGNTKDMTIVLEDGTELWGEVWTCATCGHDEYFDDVLINTADCCDVCDSCWFCGDDRIMCSCYAPQTELVNTGALSQGNYDGMCDIDEEGF